MKTRLTAELSKQSLEETKKLLNSYKEAYIKGVNNAVKYATEAMYNKVLEYCYANGISEHTNHINWEYDETSNIGRVWTNNMVIIFNEMGTGIVGSNNPHPNPNGAFKSWRYDVNEHGEKGWTYPKSDGTYGWTKGLPSRHMFYDAFNDIKDEIGDMVEVELQKTVGDLY